MVTEPVEANLVDVCARSHFKIVRDEYVVEPSRTVMRPMRLFYLALTACVPEGVPQSMITLLAESHSSPVSVRPLNDHWHQQL